MSKFLVRRVRTGQKRFVRLTLSIAAGFALLSMTAMPAFAWNSSQGTTTPSASTLALGGSVSDTVPPVITNDGPSSTSPAACPAGNFFGCIVLKVYSGTCSSYSTTTTYFSTTIQITSAAESTSYPSGGHSYTSASFTPSTPGNYVWAVYYTGTGSGDTHDLP
jgi:hypothetical protein